MTLQLDTTILELGRDSERIKPEDAARQKATVNRLLRSFFGPLEQRHEVQMVADEVGMGKTFVALALAYTVLSSLRDKEGAVRLPDLDSCYRCVLVLTPGGNRTLAHKWDQEDEALLTRCSKDPVRTRWFKSELCESADQLLQAIYRANDLRRRDQPVVLVAQSSVFTKRLSDAAVRFITASLFRWWGVGLRKKIRARIVRGLATTAGSGDWQDKARWSGRGSYDIQLWDWDRHKRFLEATDTDRREWLPAWERRLFQEVSVPYEDVAKALDRLAKAGGADVLDDLRTICTQAPRMPTGDRRTNHYQQWTAWFQSLKSQLRDVFKRLWPYLLERKLPLVISDEAHHWRNNETNDFRAVRDFIAPFAKRMLLLTATPFQLEPREIINVLNVIDHMEAAIGRDRVEALQELRKHLEGAMEQSQSVGRAFAREWGSLADQMSHWQQRFAAGALPLHDETDPRTTVIDELWHRLQTSSDLQEMPGPLRPFFKQALELKQANARLRSAMTPLVIRHRRSTQHRRYWVGREYPPNPSAGHRPDQDRLHLAPGRPLEPADELVQYLLMKVVASNHRGRRRTALGTAITGCYTTMWESREGRSAINAAVQGDQQGLLRLLKKLTQRNGAGRDEEHPKLRTVVHTVLDRWEQGEKTLIFCFRVPTARALHDALSDGVAKRLKQKSDALLRVRGTQLSAGSDPAKAMQQFRRSLTAREGGAVTLFLDRVLTAWLIKHGVEPPKISEADIRIVAELAARAIHRGQEHFADLRRPDRVFLHRALEHAWAKRLLSDSVGLPPLLRSDPLTEKLLEAIAAEQWVCHRYGRATIGTTAEADGTESTEHGARSSLAAQYSLLPSADPQKVRSLEEVLTQRMLGVDSALGAGLVDGPNIFAPYGTVIHALDPDGKETADRLRDSLLKITTRQNEWDWSVRSEVMDALVRALLRDDILLRMPLEVFQGHDETWAERLFHGLYRSAANGTAGESLAHRVVAFLSELERLDDKARTNYLAYAKSPKATSVALVTGDNDADSRTEVFGGFNTPLLPEILICTAVGQEGIDLHRECRHVIHYDLGWNPAAIEQRTGRTDRIGSKTERERAHRMRAAGTHVLPETQLSGLDVSLPYLAATYDERMFEALRTRAQIFEILTGGDPTADREAAPIPAGIDDEGSEMELGFVPLPLGMLADLKVDLSVFRPMVETDTLVSSERSA